MVHGLEPPPVDELIARALAEDFGVEAEVFLGGRESQVLARDVTTAPLVPADAMFAGAIVARTAGVVCGLTVAARTWEMLSRAAGRNEALAIELTCAEGDRVDLGSVVARVSGPAGVVLGGERTALNLLMVLSGIATEAARWQGAAGADVVVLDTRKTLPGLRALSKWAVEVGGATPHRMGLWDMVLVKDNHIRLAGGLTAAVMAARRAGPALVVEVEADTIEQASEAAVAGADIVLLDNMTPTELASAVAAVTEACEGSGRTCLTEASGGVTLDGLGAIVAAGVDRVSTSALALARPLDFALDEDAAGR